MRKLALATAFMALSGCSNTCSNTIVSRSRAPDGQHEAVMFQRDCGATTGFSTQISVLDEGGGLAGAGNAFRADDDHGAARAGEWGGPWAEMKWLSRDHLLVRYAAKSRIFAQENELRGVRITYQAVGG